MRCKNHFLLLHFANNILFLCILSPQSCHLFLQSFFQLKVELVIKVFDSFFMFQIFTTQLHLSLLCTIPLGKQSLFCDYIFVIYLTDVLLKLQTVFFLQIYHVFIFYDFGLPSPNLLIEILNLSHEVSSRELLPSVRRLLDFNIQFFVLSY